MANLSATMEADFSKFTGECDKAVAAMGKIQGEAEQTANAVGQSMEDMGRAGQQSGSGFGAMATELKTVDKTLNAFGLSIGKEIGMLEELGQMSGKTASQIGKLGTAMSVAGAAMAGWQIGRKIAELTGSDKWIGDTTARLLGWSDASQVATNNADILARAFKVTGQVFTDVHAASEALRNASRENAAQMATTSTLVVAWNKELTNAKGGLAALKGEIEAGNLTTDQMRQRFHVSAEAIDYQRRMMALASDETRKKAAADKEAAAEAQRHADAIKQLQASMFGTDSITKAGQYVTALGGVENLTRMSKEAQTSMNTELGKAIDAYTRMGVVAPQALRDIYTATLPLPPIVEGLGDAFANVGKVALPSLESIVGPMKKLTEEAAKYEAETQRQADAWNRGERAGQTYKDTVAQTTQTQQQAIGTIVQLNAALGQNATAYERAIAGANLLAAYAKSGVATSGSIGLGGYEFDQLKQTGVPGGWGGVGWAQGTAPGAGQAWGNNNTLNVNVNSTDAQNIANKLVTEMRHQGVRM